MEVYVSSSSGTGIKERDNVSVCSRLEDNG
jgi:hypothetical protein